MIQNKYLYQIQLMFLHYPLGILNRIKIKYQIKKRRSIKQFILAQQAPSIYHNKILQQLKWNLLIKDVTLYKQIIWKIEYHQIKVNFYLEDQIRVYLQWVIKIFKRYLILINQMAKYHSLKRKRI